jgi:predicted Zn-dependent peptidase
VYAATDASKAEQVSLLIADSINQMSQLSGIENDIFRIAKEHLLYDYLKEFSTSRRANRMIGTQVLTLDRIVHPFEIQQRIQAISLQDIQIAAELYLFNAPFAFSALGRVENLPKYDTLRAKMCSPIQQQT